MTVRMLLTAVMFFLVGAVLGVACAHSEPEPVEPAEPRPEGAFEEEERPEIPPAERTDRGGPRSPFTHLPAEEEGIARRPLLVTMDNHPQARPQAGLIDAEMVFEVMAEGGITRLLPVFLSHAPEVVGPVRSARPYHLDLAESLDAVLVHCGASPEGYRQIEARGMAVFNELWGAEGFFRHPRDGANFEHTLFVSLAEVRAAMGERGMERDEIPEPGWSFAGVGRTGSGGAEAAHVEIRYPGYAGYRVGYRWEKEMDAYLRSVGDAPHSDAEGEQISVANILVVRVPIWPKPGDPKGRLNMDLFAGGEGLLISGGEARDIWWEMEPHSPMQFVGPDGDRISLREGPVWIQIVPPDAEVRVSGRESQ